jgi:hypothetical protein
MSELRLLRLKVTCFGGISEALGLYLGNDVELSRGFRADAEVFKVNGVVDFLTDLGEPELELSVLAGLVILAGTRGDLDDVLLSSDASLSFESLTIALTIAIPLVRRDSFTFSLLPITSVKALETEALEICPKDCLITEGRGIPGFFAGLTASWTWVGIVRQQAVDKASTPLRS